MSQNSNLPRYQKDRKLFFLSLFGFLLYLAYRILKPFLNTIIISILLASFSFPLYSVILKKVGGKKGVASLAISLLVVCLIVIPMMGFTTAVVNQGVRSVSEIQNWLKGGNLEEAIRHSRFEKIKDRTMHYITFINLKKFDIQANLIKGSKAFGQYLITRGAGILSNIAGIIMRFFIMIFLLYYLLKDGPDMLEKIKYLSPLKRKQEERIVNKIKSVSRSALLGSFLTAFAQGLAGGIGLAITGIPGFFWGAMMGFGSLIPVIGTAVIWVPASAYLFIIGKTGWGIFLIVWSIVVVGSIDNFLRPFLMRGEEGMSPFFVFLAILGGIQVFGFIGIIYGPLILGLCAVFIYIYEVEYAELLENDR